MCNLVVSAALVHWVAVLILTNVLGSSQTQIHVYCTTLGLSKPIHSHFKNYVYCTLSIYISNTFANWKTGNAF